MSPLFVLALFTGLGLILSIMRDEQASTKLDALSKLKRKW